MSETLEAPVPTEGAFVLLAHYQCECQDPLPPGVKVAVCGTHILGIPAVEGSEDCLVCEDLVEEPCPICGD